MSNEAISLELTDEQKKLALSLFTAEEEIQLSELTQKVFNDPYVNGRSKEGAAVKKYLSSLNIKKIRTTGNANSSKFVEFNSAQREIIETRCSDPDASAYKIAVEIFPDQEIVKTDRYTRAVKKYIEEFKGRTRRRAAERTKVFEKVESSEEFEVIKYAEEEAQNLRHNLDEYRPPVTTDQAIARINKYLNYNWKQENLKPSQIKQANTLMGYLRVFRFRYQINSYSRQEDRELFEDAFIRYAHDKEDLTQEELDQFITLANEVVIAADIQRRIDSLRVALDTMASDSDGKKISMGLNEAINNAQTEYNQCISRQEKLYKTLTVNRSKRIELMQNENASILNLVQAWKQEEYRAKMILLAEKQKEALASEVEKLSSIDEWKAVIKGLDPKEVLS
jgi:hypothetical protein